MNIDYQSLFSNSPDAILLIDFLTFEIIETNHEAEQLFLLAKEEIVSKNIFELFKIELSQIEKNSQAISEMKEKGIIRKFDNIIKRGNGEELPVEAAIRIINYSAQIFQLVTIRDIKERKLYESKILEAKNKADELNQLKTNFLSNISHELRTPLISILGYSEYIEDDSEEEHVKEIMRAIYKSGQRLLDTIGLLLDLSFINSQKVEFRQSIVKPKYILEEIIELYSEKAAEKNLSFSLLGTKDDFFIKADLRMLNIIIKNIVDNAVKYSDKGTITIKLDEVEQTDKKYVVIKISDQGKGICKEKMSLVFEEFRQESEGYTRKYDGTGLGLTVAKKFTEYNNGKLEISSVANVGTEITICFPVFEHQNITMLENDKSQSNSLKTSVILFEGDETTTDLVSRITSEIFEIRIVHSAQEFKHYFKNSTFDIAIFDVTNINFYEIVYLLDHLNNINSQINKLAILPEYERLEVDELAKRGIGITYYKPISVKSFRDFVQWFVK